MPPLAVDGLKAAAEHHAPQQHPVLILLLCDGAAVRMGDRAEQIEGTAHVQLLAGPHVQQRQIDRAAAAVAGLPGDVALGEERLLFQIRVEVRLHAQILILDAPEDEMPDRGGGAIGVEDLQPVAHDDQLAAGGLQGARRLDREQGAGLLVAVDPVADEVVGGIVADLLHDLRDIVRQQHEAGGIHGGVVSVFRPHGVSFSAAPAIRPGRRRCSHSSGR